MSKFCCAEFEKDATVEKGARVSQFEWMKAWTEKNGTHHEARWDIGGCCGGHCSVVSDMRFCPYCGTKLEPGE